ncbi:flavin reductase family protein [Bacillus safensis]|uniref:flavin reductase family protein n=1 Tax=Bacillus safensis TaxID=561879 RepID=UPI002FFE5742
MRKNIGAKSYVLPQPVFIIAAYDESGIPNAMASTWGGISNENEISICISSERKTLKNIMLHGAFTVSMSDASFLEACDYLGNETGNEVPDKFARAGFHAVKADFVDAPLIKELPFALECKVKSYNEKEWRMIAEIVNISVEEDILDEKGKVSLDKFSPLVFDRGSRNYHKIGEKVGNAFEDGLYLKNK